MAHAAQIAFTLFADICQYDERNGELDIRMNQSLNDRQHACDSGSVVAGSRRVQTKVSAYAIDRWIKWSVGGKDSIQMCGEHDHRAAAFRRQVCGGENSDDVANVIELDIAQSDFSEPSGSPPERACSPKGGAGMATRLICQSMMACGLLCIQAKAAWTGRRAASVVTRENAVVREKSAIPCFRVAGRKIKFLGESYSYSTE